MKDSLTIGKKKFKSRLLMGSSRYPNHQIMLDSLNASGTEVVTVAIRRISLKKYNENIIDVLKKKYFILPNTAGCFTIKEAVLTAELAREALKTNFVKLEVIGNDEDLLPDVENLIPAAKQLVKRKFNVLPYCNDDPLICRKLQDVGCAAVMPLAAPIGSGMGIQNQQNIKLIVQESNVPVIIDAGVGTASDVAIAMELGCDGVLLNTAVAEAQNPILMAKAMAEAIKPHLAPDAVVTDVGSVKASVMAEMMPVLPRFVGSHPMAGSEQTGVANARADLFETAVCAVTSTDQSDAACVARVNEFWTALGSHVIFLPAAERDTIVARTSHLPHVLASALVTAELGRPREGEAAFLGTGFRDTPRLASGSPAMWRDIAMDNAPAIEQAIDDLQAELATLKTALNAREAAALETFFAKGQEFRQQWIAGLEDGERK